MEKSSEVVLSDHEKKQIRGEVKLQKQAGKTGNPQVPERFEGYYTHDELKQLAGE